MIAISVTLVIFLPVGVVVGFLLFAAVGFADTLRRRVKKPHKMVEVKYMYIGVGCDKVATSGEVLCAILAMNYGIANA